MQKFWWNDFFQTDSQNIFVVRSLSNSEREAPIINAKCWQRSHWSRRRDSCVLHLWTAGVLRQLVTLQPLMGGVGRGLAREWPDCPNVPRPLSLSITQTFSLPSALAPLEFSLDMDKNLYAITITYASEQIETEFCNDYLHQWKYQTHGWVMWLTTLRANKMVPTLCLRKEQCASERDPCRPTTTFWQHCQHFCLSSWSLLNENECFYKSYRL